MAVADADYRFTYVDVGTNGRVSDRGVFSQSSLFPSLQDGRLNLPAATKRNGTDDDIPFFFIGDDAFPLRPDLMKPYPQRNLDQEQRIYNYHLCRSRRIIENAFGILSHRFRVFLTTIQLAPEVAEQVVLAGCVLHNLLRTQSCAAYVPPVLVDVEESSHAVQTGYWRREHQLIPLAATRGRNATTDAKHVRELLKAYFNSANGSVPW